MGSHVLVVEDEEPIREMVAEVLDSEGYAVQTASNGAEALQAIERDRPQMVLLDMRMPIMDGWAFAREVRAREVELPIVVMTAAANARAWCDEIGGDDCLPKPFDIDALLSTVERYYTV